MTIFCLSCVLQGEIVRLRLRMRVRSLFAETACWGRFLS